MENLDWLEWELEKGHRDDCRWKKGNVPLDVCDCTKQWYRDRIAELEKLNDLPGEIGAGTDDPEKVHQMLLNVRLANHLKRTEKIRKQADRIAELEDLVKHCWVHSGYKDCGRRQMTTGQKALYDHLTGSDRVRIEEKAE